MTFDGSLFNFINDDTSQGPPRHNTMLSELVPNELARPVPACPETKISENVFGGPNHTTIYLKVKISDLPLLAIINPVISSGVQPPIANTVNPITVSGTPNV